jgi:hypothetical protein
MGIVRYVCWRFSPAGKAAYRSYALTRDPQRTFTAAPTRRVRAQATGYAARWQDFERPRHGIRRAR